MANHHVCPAFLAGMLDNRLRRWLQNPDTILRPFIRQGMIALDLGCGPGFFTVDMARMVGAGGRVIACDLQPAMLARLRRKVARRTAEERITFHLCSKRGIGWSGKADFVLAFYVIHEIADQPALFDELRSLLQPDGRILVVEPPLHVSASDFALILDTAQAKGFRLETGPNMLFHKTAVLVRD